MPRKGVVTTNPLYWMPVNIQEWIGKLAGGLTTEQFGALTMLVLTSWQQTPPCTLPDDPVFLAQKSGMGSRWTKNEHRILTVGQFYPAAGRLVCPWMLALYKEQLQTYENRVRANKGNRAQRDQRKLGIDELPTNGDTNGRTNGGTNRTTKGRTIPTTNLKQVRAQKGEGVAPTELTPDPAVKEKPDAPAPEGARAGPDVRQSDGKGLTAMRPATDILRLAGIEPPRQERPVS